MSDKFIIIDELVDRNLAEVIVSFFNSNGIKSQLIGSGEVSGHPVYPANSSTKVLVEEGKIEEAKKLYKEFQK